MSRVYKEKTAVHAIWCEFRYMRSTFVSYALVDKQTLEKMGAEKFEQTVESGDVSRN